MISSVVLSENGWRHHLINANDEFRHNYRTIQSGKIIKGANTKDVWFYLSRANVAAKGKIIAGKPEAEKIISQQRKPADIEAKWWENIRLKPPAKLVKN